MILVTGANGNFGKAVIEILIQKKISPSDITGLVRDREKATKLEEKGVGFRIADYDDYTTLVSAFSGVEKLLLVSGTDLVNRARQHENAVKAAVRAGIRYICYTSFERRNETETSPIYPVAAAHLHTENAILESGIPYTIMRNNIYMDGLPIYLGPKVIETGIFLPAGDTKGAYALRGEMAEAAANILSSSGHENKVYYISNSKAVSFPDMAEMLSEITGKNVTYTSPDIRTFTAALSGAGVPGEAIRSIAGFAEGVRQGEFLPDRTDLEMLLGRKPTSVREFLTGLYS